MKSLGDLYQEGLVWECENQNNQIVGLNMGSSRWENGGSFHEAWGSQGLLTRLSSLTLGAINGLLTLRSDGDVEWQSRGSATQ